MNRPMAWGAMLVLVATASSALAQEPAEWPGWTFIPSFGVSEIYDDNITLFGRGTEEAGNNDLITSYTPQAELAYNGRRTRLGTGYSGSLLSYRTHSMFNRWDQRAQVSLRRTESARVDWSLQGSLTMRPSTDSLDFDGIPFSHTGATALSGRAGVSYRLGGRDSISTSLHAQKVQFDRPGELLPYLRGGEAVESFTTYQRRISSRTSVGGTYSLRRASAVGESEALGFHGGRAAFDYQASRHWTLNAGAGIDYVGATAEGPAQSAPALSVAADRNEGLRRFHVRYQRMVLPSFGFGGAIQGQELGVSYSMPLFGSRRFYTEHSAMLRDSRPLIEAPGRLRLRSFRTNSSLGWAPQPWVRLEGFYSRVQQTSLIPGGAIDRNRIGFVILTSRPVRVQ